jgi:hypothetical protein
MRPRPALNLREIGLADRLAPFLPDGVDDLLPRHFAAQATQTWRRSGRMSWRSPPW